MKHNNLSLAAQLCALLVFHVGIATSPSIPAAPADLKPGDAAPPGATVIHPVARIGYPDDYHSFPGVAAQAAALDHDPLRLYQFVRDQVRFESYPGILRGPRGTLWSRAGNAADQADLLYALLRESGLDARYAQRRLDPTQQRRLLATLFHPVSSTRLPGVEPSGQIATPLDDPQLLAETRDHWWIQLHTTDGWLDLDPSYPDLSPGQSIADPQTTPTRPPDGLYHRITLRVRLERISDGQLQTSYPLNYQGRVADLYAERIDFRHMLEQMGAQGGMEAVAIAHAVAARQRRYQPVLRIGDRAVVGSRFTEAEGLNLNSPIGQIGLALGGSGKQAGPLSGEWLEFTLTAPGGHETRIERVVFDRLGPDARQRKDFDRLRRKDMDRMLLGTHLSILFVPGQLPVATARARIDAVLTPLISEHDNLRRLLVDKQDSGRERDIRRFLLASLLPYDARLWTSLAYPINLLMAAADATWQGDAEQLGVKAYYDSPRLLITSLTELAGDGGAFSIDLRHNPIRALAYPGQDKLAEQAFRAARGLRQGALEGLILTQITGKPVISVPRVFEAAKKQAIPLRSLTPEQRDQVEQLTLTQDTRQRIAADLDAGYRVLVPERFVTLDDGRPHSAWWRIDPANGEVVAVMEGGLHQATLSWVNIMINVVMGEVGKFCKNCETAPIDVLVGFDSTLSNYAGSVLHFLTPDKPWETLNKQAKILTLKHIAIGVGELLAAGQGPSAEYYFIGALLAVQVIDKL